VKDRDTTIRGAIPKRKETEAKGKGPGTTIRGAIPKRKETEGKEKHRKKFDVLDLVRFQRSESAIRVGNEIKDYFHNLAKRKKTDQEDT
jgi:hypothetical protein